MKTCTSGRHAWSDETSASRCCNGWHRELRIDGPEPADDQQGRTSMSHLPQAPQAVFVWVKDEDHQENHDPASSLSA
jgi:hypothetical protein